MFKAKGGEKRKLTIRVNLILYVLCTLIGLLEGGVMGAIVGLTTALLCSFLVLLALIPIAGIYFYWHLGNWLNPLLASLGKVSVPLTQGIAFWVCGIIAVIVNIFFTGIVIVFLLASIKRKRA